MSAALIIFMPEDPSQSWPWAMGDTEGLAQDAAEKQALSRMTQTAIIVLSGQTIAFFKRDLPKLRGRDRVSAAGYAVEEKLGSGLGGQHIALSDGPEATEIAVVSNAYMEAVETALDAAEIKSKCWYADFNVLGDKGAVLFQNRLINPAAGYSVDRSWDEETYSKPNVLSPRDFADSVNPEDAVNLRQGAFAARSYEGSVKGWGRVAALIVACCTAALLWQAGNMRALNMQTAQLKADTSALYANATGEAAPSNPALAVTRKMKNSGGPQTDFLTLSSALFAITAQIEGVIIDSVQYDVRRNQLSLQILYPAFNTATEIETLARDRGFQFEAGGVREQGGGLRGEAVLRTGMSAP